MCTVYIETESRHFACKLSYCPMINDSERYKNPSLFCINKAVGFIDIVVIDTVIVIASTYRIMKQSLVESIRPD